MTHSPRLFFALWPDHETRQRLAHLNQSVTTKNCAIVPPHNLHVTLVFLGCADALAIQQAVADITAPAFTLTFDHLSYWPKPQILCLTCRQPIPDETTILISALETVATNCGLHIDTRPYIPHITLTRHARYLPELTIEPVIWHAESFCLIESRSETDGVCYRVIKQWPLITSAANQGQ